MKIYFNCNCLGYGVGGYNRNFEIEIEEWEIEDMTEKEKNEYIENTIYEYILENLDFGYEIEE